MRMGIRVAQGLSVNRKVVKGKWREKRSWEGRSKLNAKNAFHLYTYLIRTNVL
jgi:hypothetical protein